MENIKEEARIYAGKLWDEKLKKEFENKINKSFIEILKELKIEINDYNSSIKSGIDILDKQFNDKWDKKFDDERSQLESLKNQNNNYNDNNNEENKLKDNKEELINNNNNNNINGYNGNEMNIKNNIHDDYYEDDEKLRKKVIDLKYLKEPILNYLKLLENANPLINIILQCLCNINEIVFYYLNPEKENKILKKSKENPKAIYLSPSFLKLLDHLWKSNQKEYEPLEIHDILKLLMQDYFTDDPGMIINYILTELNDELNINQDNNNNNNISKSDPFDDYNLELVKKRFSEKFSKNKTKISNAFYSSIIIKKRCLKCQAEPMCFFEASPVINIYLVENKNDNLNKLSLEEHFHNLLNVEEEQNIKEKCLICNSLQEKRQTKEVFSGSEVLIININRKKDKDNTIYFKYPETFDGQKIINPQMPVMSNYKLTTVIKKAKNYSNNNYYYVAYYRNFIDECWYCFDNKKIVSIQNNYKYHILDEKKAVVLIYTKIK